MRIHASGVGATAAEAMVKVREELKTKARHLHEVVHTTVGNVTGLEPDKQRETNEHADMLERFVLSACEIVKPKAGQHVRILVSGSDDDVNSHIRVEIDLIRG